MVLYSQRRSHLKSAARTALRLYSTYHGTAVLAGAGGRRPRDGPAMAPARVARSERPVPLCTLPSRRSATARGSGLQERGQQRVGGCRAR